MKVESINCSYNKYKLPNKKHNSVGFRAASPKLFQQKPNFASRIKAFINSLFKKEQAVKGGKAKLQEIGFDTEEIRILAKRTNVSDASDFIKKAIDAGCSKSLIYNYFPIATGLTIKDFSDFLGLGFTDFGKLNDLAEQLYDDDKNYDKRFIEAAKEIYKETGEFNSHLVFSCRHSDTKEYLPEIFEFIKANLNENDLYRYLEFARNSALDKILPEKVEICKYIYNSDIWNQISPIMAIIADCDEIKKDDCKELFELFEKIDAYDEEVDDPWLNSCVKNVDELKTILRIFDTALKKKEILREAQCEITTQDIYDLIMGNQQRTMFAVNTLGEKSFIDSFKHKYDYVEDYMQFFADSNNKTVDEDLLRVINPENSSLYKELESKIKALKKSLADSPDKQKTIKAINNAAYQKNKLIKDSIKDPKDKLELAIMYFTVKDGCNEAALEKIKQYMNYKTDEEKAKFYEVCNELIFDVLETDLVHDPHPNIKRLLDFSKSKYLPALFNCDAEFKENFNLMVSRLYDHLDKNVLNCFNSLPQNIETKAAFAKLGLHYSKWVKSSKYSFVETEVKLDTENMKQHALTNFEKDINDDLYKLIPDEEKQKIAKALKSSGFDIKEIEQTVFGEGGWFDGTKKVLKLYKNDKPAVFEDLKEILNIFNTEFNTTPFWTREYSDESINNAKENFKTHISKLRYNEVKNALTNKKDRTTRIRVEKTNMNNIPHALFLGNHASCCTAVDSFNGWSAPAYIMNKLISSIEVKDGDNFIGNTMCYIALIDNKPALVLDNIELKPQYQYNDKIRDAIFEYAKKLSAEIGKPKMAIYLGPNRHKVNLDEFPIENKHFTIVGSTGDDKIYLDYDAEAHQISKDLTIDSPMYKIR